MTKKLTKVAMTTALAAAAIVPAVVATPAQAAEAEVTFAKAYYSTANGTAAFEAGKLSGVISATTDTGITHLEASNGEVFTMQAFSAYLAVNPTATTDQVLTALSTAGKALSADQVKALDVKEGKVDGGKVTVDPTAVQKTALNEAIAKAEASPKAAELKDAIAAAKAVAAKADATQAEVDAAVKALNEAIAKAETATELKVESVKAINANSNLAGATVKPNESFDVAFNVVLDEKTITNENISVKKGGLAVPVTLTLSEDKKSVKVVPSQPLDVKTDFTLTVNKEVKSATGEALAAESTTSFTTADAVVVTSFKINNKTLEQGNFNATDLTTGITLVANKDLDGNTVNTSTVKLYNKTDSKFVPLASAFYIPGSKTISVNPLAASVENNKAYELRLDGVKALDGTDADGYTQAFSLGAKVNATITVPANYDSATTFDKVNPSLTGSVVKLGATNNASADKDYTLDAFRVNVSFNGRSIDTATLKPGSIKLVETDDNGIEIAGTEVAGAITYDAATYAATFIPTKSLKEDTNYKVLVTKAIKDTLGLEVDEKTIKFKTGDFTAPTVVSSNIDTGKRLGAKEALKVTFSEKLASARLNVVAPQSPVITPAYTATESVMVLDKDGKTVAATVTLDPADTTGKTYSILPTATAGWNVNETYTVKVNGKNYNVHLSAADEAGNQLASEYSTTFTTADTSIPSVTSVKAYSKGYTGAKANVELLGSSASNPVTGITESGATAAQESIYIQFNRVVDGGFLLNSNYELSTDGGKTFAQLPATWTPTATADDNGKNTIVTLTPDSNAIVAGEARYVIRLKKDTATAAPDSKKLTEDVTVYYSTEVAKPSVTTTKVFTGITTDAADTKLPIATNTTKAAELNNGIELNFSEKLTINSINNSNIKIEDVTSTEAPVALVGAFYEDITQTGTGNAASDFNKTLLSTTAGAETVDSAIFWAPSSDDNKFKAGRDYKVTIDGVKDAVGNQIAAPYISYFTVADTAAPTIVETSITNGQQGVSVEPTFTVKFSKDVTEATVKAGITLSDGVPVDVKYDKATRTATVKPLVFLNKLTTYNLQIASTIADTAGTTLGAATNIAFTTENVEAKAAIQSATWNATAKTLTLALNQPVKVGSTPFDTDVIINGTQLSGSDTDIAISQDRKTIVLSQAAGQTFTILPGVHAVSFAENGSIVPATGNYKEAVTVSTLTAATGTVTYGTPVDAVSAVAATKSFSTGGNGFTVTADTAGVAGNDYSVVFVAGTGASTPMSAAIAGNVITVTLGTDASSALDATLNTGTLIAAAVNVLAGVSAAAEGTGAEVISAAATGVNLAGGLDAVAATTVTVGGTTITKTAAAGNGTTTFSTPTELATAIDAIATVDATENGGVITVTASTGGVAGNLITLVKGGAGTTTVSGATLAGGTAAGNVGTQTGSNSIVIK